MNLWRKSNWWKKPTLRYSVTGSVIISAVAGHPVLGYTPVHYCGLADTGALCIPTPGAYQSGDRGVPVPASGVSTQESVQPHRECGRTTAVVQEGSQSQNSILVLRASIIVIQQVSSPVGNLASWYPRQLVSPPVGSLAKCTVSQIRGCRADVTDVQCTNSSRSPLQCSTASNILRQYKSKVRTLQKSKVQGNN